MIQNIQELKATLDRIEYFQKQVEKLRQVETNPRNYELSAGGFLTEIERMNLEVHHFLVHYIYTEIFHNGSKPNNHKHARLFGS